LQSVPVARVWKPSWKRLQLDSADAVASPWLRLGQLVRNHLHRRGRDNDHRRRGLLDRQSREIAAPLAAPSQAAGRLRSPAKDPFPFAMIIDADDSQAEIDRQERANEEIRLSSLSLSYLIENKDSAAVRELSTGIRRHDGHEHTFESCFVQILAPGQHVDVPNMRIPAELCEGMTEENRAENFLYWAHFRDSGGRRWEATYDPEKRVMDYTLLSR